MNHKFSTELMSVLPTMHVTVSNNAIASDRIYLPVEENRMATELNDEDRAEYDKASEFINTSINIFGDLFNIECSRVGDVKNNISASEFRYNLALDNGWSPELDTSIDFQKEIDDVYNPNVILERANMFYGITKKRRDLVTDCQDKIDNVIRIIRAAPEARVLIISKRGEFAREITKRLNDVEGIPCGDYHDAIETTPAYGANGLPMLIKSGANKGHPRMMGAQALSTLNMKRFNNGDIKVLSIKSTSSNKLKIDVKKRFVDVDFIGETTTVFKLYCLDTVEQRQLEKQRETPIITVTDNASDFIRYNENNGDIIL